MVNYNEIQLITPLTPLLLFLNFLVFGLIFFRRYYSISNKSQNLDKFTTIIVGSTKNQLKIPNTKDIKNITNSSSSNCSNCDCYKKSKCCVGDGLTNTSKNAKSIESSNTPMLPSNERDNNEFKKIMNSNEQTEQEQQSKVIEQPKIVDNGHTKSAPTLTPTAPTPTLTVPTPMPTAPASTQTPTTASPAKISAIKPAPVPQGEIDYTSWKSPNDPLYIDYSLVKQRAPRKPTFPSDDACCGNGCVRCVYDIYDDQLERWEKRRDAAVQEQIELYNNKNNGSSHKATND